MTDYRIPPTMNLWTDDNASLMEAFMSSSDLTSFWAAPSAQPTPQPAHPQAQPQSSASTSDYPKAAAVAPSQPSITPFNQETLMQRLQALIEGARESWTYAIFWQSSYDYSGGTVLGWGEGFYKDERDKGKAKAKTTTSAADQEYRKKSPPRAQLLDFRRRHVSRRRSSGSGGDRYRVVLPGLDDSVVRPRRRASGSGLLSLDPGLGCWRPAGCVPVRAGETGPVVWAADYGLRSDGKWGG
ncbi:hypothetical protein Prudu_013582 [Prunus dulcis]|uniref:Transcription factor n=1 Tax=Prunus dulcis TaxID=3755 RepID=A0A4Y1RFR9_PRUDU|nr:hypothetical protein Prudu_013582 [Prunus dulcis]